MVFNMLTTGVMTQLGKVHYHLMIDMRATNGKLRARALGIVAEVAGVPDAAARRALDACRGALRGAKDAGCRLVEIGVPFSDPVADGPVIQRASARALSKGVNLSRVLEITGKIRNKMTDIPIILFSYYNPIFVYGPESFFRDAVAAGADGVLVVDLPPEEAREYRQLLTRHGIATIFLVAPTSSEERIARITAMAAGFVYYVSRTGVTGERADVEASVPAMVTAIKKHTAVPVAVGFGISTPQQAARVARDADGVIVGSAIVRMIGELGDSPETAARVGAFAESLAKAVKHT